MLIITLETQKVVNKRGSEMIADQHLHLDTHLHRKANFAQGSRHKISTNTTSGRSSILIFFFNFDDVDDDDIFDILGRGVSTSSGIIPRDDSYTSSLRPCSLTCIHLTMQNWILGANWSIYRVGIQIGYASDIFLLYVYIVEYKKN